MASAAFAMQGLRSGASAHLPAASACRPMMWLRCHAKRAMVRAGAGAGVAEAKVLPLLPFPLDDILLPGMTKDLHLYEPRYLDMLREVMDGERELVTVVVVQASEQAASTPGAFSDVNASYCYAVITRVIDTRELSVGTMVRVQAVQRAEIRDIEFTARQFLTGSVAVLPDLAISSDEARRFVLTGLGELQGLVADVMLLYAKLPRCPEAAQLRRALQWVDMMDYQRSSPDAKDIVRAQRLSYAVLVPPMSATTSDLAQLQERRIVAMSTRDCNECLVNAIDWLKHVRAGLSARLALSLLDQPNSTE